MSVILLYHRVATLTSDPWNLAVSRERFADHLDALATQGHFMGLSAMLRLSERGSLPSDSIAITFDDGYADGVLHATPLLESRGVPATFFVISGSVGQKREFWWDELEQMFLQPGELPPSLELTLNGRRRSWELSAAQRWTAEDALRHSTWRAADNTAIVRQRLYRELWGELVNMRFAEREHTLDLLRRWSGVDTRPRMLNTPFSAEQVRRLAESPQFEVGAHTVTHPRLTALSVDEQLAELAECRQSLQSATGRTVDHFAYPFGAYSHETIELVREAGYSSAATIEPGTIRAGTDPHVLPRLLVADWDADGLLREVSQWLPSVRGRTSFVVSARAPKPDASRNAVLRIPRIFHRVWLGGKPIPDEFARFGESWLRLHPGWAMKLWTEDNMPELRNQAQFDAGQNPAQKGDVAKYELIYQFGGIYLDMDFECLRNIEPLLYDTDAFAGWESEEFVNVAIIGAVKGHPAFREVIAALPESLKGEVPGRQDLSTGPGLFTRIILQHPNVVLFGPELFYPYHFAEKHRRFETFPSAYAVHHWAYSWAPEQGAGGS